MYRTQCPTAADPEPPAARRSCRNNEVAASRYRWRIRSPGNSGGQLTRFSRSAADCRLWIEPKLSLPPMVADTYRPPFSSLVPIAMLKTNPDGGAIAQTIGPLKSVAPPGMGLFPKRYLVVTIDGSQEPVLFEAEK